jgi:hypothetical protein
MQNKKKMAAVSAVLAYIQEEEEIAGAVAMQARAGSQMAQASAYPPVSMWGLSGRQTQMQLRSMMQLKTFHGVRHA